MYAKNDPYKNSFIPYPSYQCYHPNLEPAVIPKESDTVNSSNTETFLKIGIIKIIFMVVLSQTPVSGLKRLMMENGGEWCA